jgi:major membrane immunogen (membrane-anchored lipoprotein)
MNKKNFCLAVLAAALGAATLMAGCAKRSYKDGVYAAASSADDSGAWGEVTVTITDGKVADCLFVTRQKDGTIKGEDYGKVNGVVSNQDFYNKAQLAVRAMDQYARAFRETGNMAKVDVVSGATIAFNQFNEAVTAALEQAVK